MSLDMYGEEMPKVENMMLYTGFEVDEVYPLKSLIFVAVSVCYSCVGLESEDECNSQPLQTCSPLQVSVVSVLPASNNACRGTSFLSVYPPMCLAVSIILLHIYLAHYNSATTSGRSLKL